MTPVTPHSAVQPHPPPPPHTQPYGDDRRHMSFDNGPQPPVYSRQPSYQPQTPLPHPQPYEYPPQYASHGELPYPIQVAAASGKRKAQRASQVGRTPVPTSSSGVGGVGEGERREKESIY
ncbi:hypothetical protein VTH82DRAFT_2316 [Thermothelomyces myriococcoides]